jgi:hypothetical protein
MNEITPELVIQLMQERYPREFEICFQQAQITLMAEEIERLQKEDDGE